jgi:hypothetical protein
VSTDQKIKRGPVVEVATRQYSEPIPDEMLPRFEKARLTVDDNDHAVSIYDYGTCVAVVWGPAVEGDWFSRCNGDDQAVRVTTRDDALIRALDALEASR